MALIFIRIAVFHERQKSIQAGVQLSKMAIIISKFHVPALCLFLYDSNDNNF